jgi:hypothetical protein
MKAPLFIIAGILGLSLAAVACDDPEEDLAPAVTPTPATTGTVPPAATSSPSAAPATGTPAPAPCSDSTSGSGTLAPARTDQALQYQDSFGKYTVSYPANWKPCADTAFQATGSGIRFIAEDGFTHAKIYVYPNPRSLNLESWLGENDPLFLDKDQIREERIIAGLRALYRPLDAEGLPRAEAYLDRGTQIVFVAALKAEEFDRLASELEFSPQ